MFEEPRAVLLRSRDLLHPRWHRPGFPERQPDQSAVLDGNIEWPARTVSADRNRPRRFRPERHGWAAQLEVSLFVVLATALLMFAAALGLFVL